MAVILIKLRGVSDDEADEVRELLTKNEINYYETSAGNWGISMPAIWLKDERQLRQAKLLIEQYQGERVIRVREEYQRLKNEGKHETIVYRFRQNPIRSLVYLAVILFIVYISTMPFIDFGK